VIKDARRRIASVTGLPLASAATAASNVGTAEEIPFRFNTPDDLVLSFRNQDRPDWKRLPLSSMQRTKPNDPTVSAQREK
jgi:hypothetical protein